MLIVLQPLKCFCSFILNVYFIRLKITKVRQNIHLKSIYQLTCEVYVVKLYWAAR